MAKLSKRELAAKNAGVKVDYSKPANQQGMQGGSLQGTMTKSGGGLNPANVGNFQTVLRDIARSSYEKRAKSDVKNSALGGVDRSQISGGVFASVMGNLEQMRGGDISKEYAAGVQGYKDTLDAIEKQREEAKASATDATANMAKSLALIKGFQDAGLEVPASLYAAVGTKDPNNPLTPEEMGIQQGIIAGGNGLKPAGIDGYADPQTYLRYKDNYTKMMGGDNGEKLAQVSKDFDEKFSHLLDPSQSDRWSQMGVKYKEDNSSIANLAPGTTGTTTIDTTKQGYSSVPLQKAGGLTQAAVDQSAWQYALTGQMPSIGLGSNAQAQAKRNAIQNRAAELDSNGSIASNKAMLTALTSTLAENTKYQSTMTRSINTVDQNLNLLEDAASKVNSYNSPLINEWNNLAKTKVIGDGDVNSYQSAIQTVRSEYSTILARGQGQTDSTRAEAAKLIPDNITKTQLQQVLNVLRSEGANVKSAADQQVAATQDQLNNIIGGRVITNNTNNNQQNGSHSGGTTSSGLSYTITY